jgi:hypothetical protein
LELLKAVFYLPLADNDGRDLAPEIQDLRAELFLRFGGWTHQGEYRGSFRMRDGSEAVDVTAVYMVLLPPDQLPELEELLVQFRDVARQEAVYLEIQRDVEVRLL